MYLSFFFVISFFFLNILFQILNITHINYHSINAHLDDRKISSGEIKTTIDKFRTNLFHDYLFLLEDAVEFLEKIFSSVVCKNFISLAATLCRKWEIVVDC